MPRVLRVEFDSPEDFEREFAENLAKGGVFVPTEESFDMRESVRVVLALAFCEEKLSLGGEVVHLVTPDLAAMGGRAGVAVQFEGSSHAVRKMLEPMRVAAGAPEHVQRDSGRRRSPRVEARVAARIDDGQNALIQGVTRDVSQTGVLVNVPGRSVPIGERVRLSLVHPSTGEMMEVEGVVARAVETEGEVAAIAVEFAPQEQQRQDVVRFVDDIQHTEHARRLGGIRGNIDELGIQHVVQMFASTTGTLTLRCNQQEGLLGFDRGLLRYAQLGPVSGIKALARLMAWRQGSFEFHTQLDPVDRLEAPLPLDAALLEATRLHDEIGRMDLRRFAPDARLGIGSEPDEDLGKLEAAVLDLARVGFNVGRMLDVIPEPDLDIYRALESLTERGVLSC